MKFAERVNRIKPSPTFAAAAKAAAMRAKGIEVISFAQGEPDFDTPDNIKEMAYKAIRDGITKYTPAAGFPELKDAIIQKFKRDNNLTYDRSQVFASAGAKLIILGTGEDVYQKALTAARDKHPLPGFKLSPKKFRKSCDKRFTGSGNIRNAQRRPRGEHHRVRLELMDRPHGCPLIQQDFHSQLGHLGLEIFQKTS